MKKDLTSHFTEEEILRCCMCLRRLKSLTIAGHQLEISDTDTTRTITVDKAQYKFERHVFPFKVIDEQALTERSHNDRKRECAPFQE